MIEPQQGQEGGHVYFSLIKPDANGKVTDEQIDGFLKGLGLNPAEVPATREEARRRNRARRRRERREGSDA